MIVLLLLLVSVSLCFIFSEVTTTFEEKDTQADVTKSEYDRFVNFSDAVFAIILTLLVIELRVPQKDNILESLNESVHHFIATVLSFSLVSVCWLEHHKLFRYIKKVDGYILVANLTMLFVVSIIGFTTQLLVKYPNSVIAFSLYATVAAAPNGIRYMILKHRKDINLSERNLELFKRCTLLLPVSCAFSVLIAALTNSTEIAVLVFLLIPAITKKLLRSKNNVEN